MAEKANVSPYVEFANQAAPDDIHRVKLAKAGDCSLGGYRFSYARSSGSAALVRQGGYYLFGAGISPKQYIDEPDPALAFVAEAYAADLRRAHFVQAYPDAGHVLQDAAEYSEEVAEVPDDPGSNPSSLAEQGSGNSPPSGEVTLENEFVSPPQVNVIRGIAGGQGATDYSAPRPSDQPMPAFDSAIGDLPGG